MEPSEQNIQADIQAWLKEQQALGKPIMFDKVPLGGMRVKGGVRVKNPMKSYPDLLLCCWGRFVGIEVKKPGADMDTPHAKAQADKRKEITACLLQSQ